MEFKDNEAIYLQIVSFVGENILRGQWKSGEKILSVREMAVELEVNPNTVMRSYEMLQGLGIIYNKRGMGLFVAEDGLEKVKAYRKENFVKQHLPQFFNDMHLLGISMKDMMQQYTEFLASRKNNSSNEHENKQ